MPGTNRVKVVRWVVVGILVVVFIAYLLFKLLGGGSPGGPIIVIQPEPEGGEGQTVVSTYKTRWFVGCPDPKNPKGWPDEAFPKPVSDIPYKYVYWWPGAEKITVTLKSSNNPIVVGSVTLMIDKSRELKIEHVKPGNAPVWHLMSNKLVGDKKVSEPDWPQDMFGEITALAILDSNGKPVSITLADLDDITIHENCWGSYMYCKP